MAASPSTGYKYAGDFDDEDVEELMTLVGVDRPEAETALKTAAGYRCYKDLIVEEVGNLIS